MSAKSTDKRVILLGDIHAGHRVGLTPESYDQRPSKLGNEVTERYKRQVSRWYKIRRALWREYENLVNYLAGPSTLNGRELIVVCNGDMVDGTGYRSGGTEQITTDMSIQADIAISCLAKWQASKYYLTYGTASHTGTSMDVEDMVADALDAPIKSHLHLDVNGVVFDIKHHPASGSSMPHTRKGPTVDALHNMSWAKEGLQPEGDVFIRNHLHWFKYTGDHNQLCIQMPALQGMGSKYGARRCHAPVHWGLAWFDVDADGSYSWDYAIKTIEEQKAKTERA